MVTVDTATFTFMHLADIQSNLFRLYIVFVSICVPWELNPQPFALLTQCSTTEPQEQQHNISGGLCLRSCIQLLVRCLMLEMDNPTETRLFIRFSQTLTRSLSLSVWLIGCERSPGRSQSHTSDLIKAADLWSRPRRTPAGNSCRHYNRKQPRSSAQQCFTNFFSWRSKK